MKLQPVWTVVLKKLGSLWQTHTHTSNIVVVPAQQVMSLLGTQEWVPSGLGALPYKHAQACIVLHLPVLDIQHSAMPGDFVDFHHTMGMLKH